MSSPRNTDGPEGPKATNHEIGSDTHRRQRGVNTSRSFVILWREAVGDSDQLSSQATFVLWGLARYMSSNGSTFVSASRVAAQCKLNRKSGKDIVGRELRQAVNLGWLEATPRPGLTTTYQAVIPTHSEGVGTGVGDLPPENADLPTLSGEPTHSGGVLNSKASRRTNRTTTTEVFEEETNVSDQASTSEDPQSETDFDVAPGLPDSLGARTERYEHLRVVYGDSWSEFSWPELSAPGLIYAFRQRGAEVFTKGVYSSPMRASGVIACVN